jgi:hypothetical protein
MRGRSDTSTVFGHDAQVDICPREAGFVLSVGRVSIWLERPSAQDLVETLGRALRLTAPSPEVTETSPAADEPPNDEPN